MKKTILTIGTMLTAIAPVITAVSCSSKEAAPKTDTKTEEIKRYFTYFKNTITIPKKTVITDNKTLLAAIKKSIGSVLTDEQKNAISIVGEYSALVLDTAKEVKIEIKVGTEKTETVTLSITHKTTDADKQEAIVNYLNKNKDITIPNSVVIKNNDQLLAAIKDVIGDKLTAEQKSVIAIDKEYKDDNKGKTVTKNVVVHVGSNPTKNWVNLNVMQEKIKLTSTLTKANFIKKLDEKKTYYYTWMTASLHDVMLNKTDKLFALHSDGYGKNDERWSMRRYFFEQKRKADKGKNPNGKNVIEALKAVGITKFNDKNELITELKKNFTQDDLDVADKGIEFIDGAGLGHTDHTNLFGFFFKVTKNKDFSKEKNVILRFSIKFKDNVYIQTVDLNFADAE